MAIAKFGVIIVDARGTIGGIVFTANKAGPYLRLWAGPTNPQSQLQTAQRAVISAAAQAWQSLSSADRDLWLTYAALPAQDLTNSLGETYSISGFLWYVRITSNLQQAGQPPRDQPPTIAIPIAPTIEAAFLKTDAAAEQSHIDFDHDDPTTTNFHVVTARLFNSEGRIAGFTNLANIITAIPVDPTQAMLTLTMTASSTFGGSPADLVDGDLDTGWSTSAVPPPQWIQGNIATSDRSITNYRWHAQDGTGTGFLPTAWTLQYWTGAAWVPVDTVTGFSPVDDAWNEFTIDVPSDSTSDRWRMNMTMQGGEPLVALGEFELFGFDPASHLKIQFQDELQTRLGTVQLGQKVFYQVRVQNDHGRRGAATSITALAEAT